MRPSEFVGVEDEWAAYCFDRAIFAFGTALQGELDSVHVEKDKSGRKAQAKKENILRKWIPEMGGPRFRDPAKR